MTQGQKLKLAIKGKGHTMESAATALGMSRQTLHTHLKGATLEKDFLQNVKQKLQIDLSEQKDNGTGNAAPIDLGDSIILNVPLINQHAHAGYMRGFADPEYIEKLSTVPFVVDKEPKGKYFAFETKGNSMNDGTSDSYLPGDILLTREVKRELWQSKLHIRKWDFVIVHKTEGIVFKRIIEHDTTRGILTLHSLNPEYEDFTAKLDDLLQLCNVVQVMRKK